MCGAVFACFVFAHLEHERCPETVLHVIIYAPIFLAST